MNKGIIRYINSKKLYDRTTIWLKLKIYSSKNLKNSINKYGEIMTCVREKLTVVISKSKSQKQILLIINSIYENLDAVLENLIIGNHDVCLKIIRSISEQLIIIKCLMQNDDEMKNSFFNWSILNDYKNPKSGVELFGKANELYDDYCAKIEKYFYEKNKNASRDKMEKYRNKIIDNKYGWYYFKSNTDDKITLKHIANNEACMDIYKMFEYYSEKVHNNDTRTLLIQRDHNLSMEYHVLVLMQEVQLHILNILKKDIDKDAYEKMYERIIKNIKIDYNNMKVCEDFFDNQH